MSLADKLIYLNDTKQQLRTALNDAGAAISESDPFRSYVNWVEFLGWELAGGLGSLFDDGEPGFLFGPLPYFQDPAGTTEATWGDPVGLIQDASGNGADFTQPTVTARPVLGRVPRSGRRNLLPSALPYGAIFQIGASSIWTTSGDENICTFTNETQFTYHVAHGLTPGETYTFSQQVALGTATTVGYAIYDHTNNAFIISPTEYVGVSADFSLMSVSFTTPAGCTSVRVYPVRWINSGTLGTARYKQPQLEIGSEATGFQVVTSQFDITEANVPSIHYLHFDGTDDLVSTTLPAITDGTVVIAGTNGIWIDDEFNFGGGTFSIGPTSYTNGPAGILAAIGYLIVGGTFVIDRQLTAEERDKVILKLKSMGAPGVLP